MYISKFQNLYSIVQTLREVSDNAELLEVLVRIFEKTRTNKRLNRGLWNYKGNIFEGNKIACILCTVNRGFELYSDNIRYVCEEKGMRMRLTGS